MRLFFEEARQKEEYLMEGLYYFLGEYPSEEMLDNFNKMDLLMHFSGTATGVLIPGTPYSHAWIYDKNKVLLLQKPWDYITPTKVRFNFFHRKPKKTFSFAPPQEEMKVIEWKDVHKPITPIDKIF